MLVLRELAPYAADLPPWVVIGLSGTLLLVVGVTWESRMRDVRTATRYVAEPALTVQRVSSGCTIWRAEWMRDFTVPTGMSSNEAMSA